MVAISALNGRIPVATLVTVQGSHLLRADAAASLERLSDAMGAAGLGPLLLSPGRSAYRSLADQRYMIAAGLTTMPAGKSQHGEAVAGDLAELGGFKGARYRWLQDNGPRFGWTQPAWARKGGVLPEHWHWEFDPDLITTPTPEADMPLSQADLEAIDRIVTGQIDKRLRSTEEGMGAVLARPQVEELHKIDADVIDQRLAALPTATGLPLQITGTFTATA